MGVEFEKHWFRCCPV